MADPAGVNLISPATLFVPESRCGRAPGDVDGSSRRGFVRRGVGWLQGCGPAKGHDQINKYKVRKVRLAYCQEYVVVRAATVPGSPGFDDNMTRQTVTGVHIIRGAAVLCSVVRFSTMTLLQRQGFIQSKRVIVSRMTSGRRSSGFISFQGVAGRTVCLRCQVCHYT